MEGLVISLGIFSSWLIFYSAIIYQALKADRSISFIIISGKQLLEYWLYILFFLSLSFYIFFLRLKNTERIVNIYDIWYNLKEILATLPWFYLLLFTLVLLLIIIFWFLLLKYIYLGMKERLLALYLYYYQYEIFWNKIVGGQIDFLIDFNDYLFSRVLIFTENPRVLTITWNIWPRSFYFLEPRICKFILPYLVLVDVLTQDGNISKIFKILPWYYIYMLIRTSWILLHAFFKEENTRFSEAIYKETTINGKIYRWVAIPNPEDFKNH